MKRAGVFVVLATLVVAGVMAGPAEEAAGEPVTLQYMTWIKSSADNAAAFDAANPGINVDVEFLGGVADYQTPLRVRLASGGPS